MRTNSVGLTPSWLNTASAFAFSSGSTRCAICQSFPLAMSPEMSKLYRTNIKKISSIYILDHFANHLRPATWRQIAKRGRREHPSQRSADERDRGRQAGRHPRGAAAIRGVVGIRSRLLERGFRFLFAGLCSAGHEQVGTGFASRFLRRHQPGQFGRPSRAAMRQRPALRGVTAIAVRGEQWFSRPAAAVPAVSEQSDKLCGTLEHEGWKTRQPASIPRLGNPAFQAASAVLSVENLLLSATPFAQ